MKLTHREKHALIIAAFIAIIFFIASLVVPSKLQLDQFLADWELVYLFVVVGPLGMYVATDPEQRNKE